MAFRRFSMPAAVSRVQAMTLLTMLAIATAGGCASAGDAPPLGREVTLQRGARLALPDDASLRYVAVTADSRCPPDVQCIRAGDADVAFEFVSRHGEASVITINTVNSPTAAIGEWQLHLVSLGSGDAPGATVKVEAGVD